MSVFKALGVVQKVLEGGAVKEVHVKRFIRADTERQASAIATGMGILNATVSWFCRNYEGDLGDNTNYASDNNKGVMTGF